jgi:hypothetical protein
MMLVAHPEQSLTVAFLGEPVGRCGLDVQLRSACHSFHSPSLACG